MGTLKKRLSMKYLKHLAFAAGLSTVGLAAIAPASAQVMPPQTMLNTLGSSCDRTTEVAYRSEVLLSPDGSIVVRAEGLLRKSVDPNSQLRAADTDGYCYPDARETVNRQIVIETKDGIRRLVDSPYSEGYIVYQPRAFSLDSRFLALDMSIIYTDGDTGSYVLFLDTSDDTIVQIPNLCDGLTFQNHIGFTSATEAIVLCQGGLRFSERLEAVDLTGGTVRSLTANPEDAVGYGSIVSAFEVIGVQLSE